MVYSFKSLPVIALLIAILFLLPASLSASDGYFAAFIDVGMEGGFGGGDWYSNYYNWFLVYTGVETYIGINLYILAGCSFVFHGFFWNNLGAIPEASLEYAFINKRETKHLLTAKVRACFVGFDVLQLDDFYGDFDFGDDVWHQGMVRDIYILGGYRMRWAPMSDFYLSPYAHVVAQFQDITDVQRVEITGGEYEPAITHTQKMYRTGFLCGVELRGPFFRLIAETGYVNNMFYLVVKAGAGIHIY